jgi:hypothetical protein
MGIVIPQMHKKPVKLLSNGTKIPVLHKNPSKNPKILYFATTNLKYIPYLCPPLI